MAGIIEDASKSMTQYFKKDGDIIILLGENREEIGMSEYLKEIHYKIRGVPPQLDLELEKKVQDLCLAGIREGIIKSAHDTAEGGLAVALAESCITVEGKNKGAEIELDDDIRADALLFGETQSRIIVTVEKGSADRLKEMAAEKNVPVAVIGKVGGDRLIVRHNTEVLINTTIQDMSDAWRKAIHKQLGEAEEN